MGHIPMIIIQPALRAKAAPEQRSGGARVTWGGGHDDGGQF
jgi:hypothetical protein